MSGKLSYSEIQDEANRREETNAKDVMGIASKGAAKGRQKICRAFAQQQQAFPQPQSVGLP